MCSSYHGGTVQRFLVGPTAMSSGSNTPLCIWTTSNGSQNQKPLLAETKQVIS